METTARKLPYHADLRHLKAQAKDLIKDWKSGKTLAATRFRDVSPKHQGQSNEDVFKSNIGLQDAQFVVAREYGFSTWTEMKEFIELTDKQRKNPNDLTEEYVQKVQYKDDSNLDARIAFHNHCKSKGIGLLQQIWDWFPFRRKARILDVGCGNGNFWDTYGGDDLLGMHITMLDTSEGMLDAAREKLKRFGDQIEIVHGNAMELPFAAEGFDAINCQLLCHHVEDKLKVIREMHRVLKPEGWAGVVTVMPNGLRRLFDDHCEVCPGASYPEFEDQKHWRNREGELQQVFPKVESRILRNDIEASNPDLMVNYVKSSPRVDLFECPDEIWDKLRQKFQDEIDRKGSYEMKIEYQGFVCRK